MDQPTQIQVYGYHPHTLQRLIGEFYAIASSEPDAYWMPQYTTRTVPPEDKQGYIVRYEPTTDSWQQIQDWADTPLYLTQTGEVYRIGQISNDMTFDGYGDLPKWLTEQARPSLAHDWSDKKGEWVQDAQRAQALEQEQAQAQMIAATEAVRYALQAAIDDKAKELGFPSGGNSLMVYALRPNPFQQKAITFFDWEASVWAAADAYKTEVMNGKQPMRSPDEAVAMMPQYPTQVESI